MSFKQYISSCLREEIKNVSTIFWISRMDLYLNFHLLHHYSSELHDCGLVEIYFRLHLNQKWINSQEVVTELLFGLPQSRWRNENNNYYTCTTIAFHGFSGGNFSWRNNACTASNILNLYQDFIIQLLSLWFRVWTFWDSQLKTSRWLIKLRKNQRKNAECLPHQPSRNRCQEQAWTKIMRMLNLWQ